MSPTWRDPFTTRLGAVAEAGNQIVARRAAMIQSPTQDGSPTSGIARGAGATSAETGHDVRPPARPAPHRCDYRHAAGVRVLSGAGRAGTHDEDGSYPMLEDVKESRLAAVRYPALLDALRPSFGAVFVLPRPEARRIVRLDSCKRSISAMSRIPRFRSIRRFATLRPQQHHFPQRSELRCPQPPRRHLPRNAARRRVLQGRQQRRRVVVPQIVGPDPQGVKRQVAVTRKQGIGSRRHLPPRGRRPRRPGLPGR